MKKILFVLLITISTLAHADRWRHGGGHYYYHPGYGWVVPAVIGGAIVYEATRPPVIIQQQPVYIQQTYPPALPAYPAPADMHWEAILDANCNCYRTVLVPNR
jgi:hypothetical protein